MVPLILNIWNEEHWIKPELIEQPGLMQVIQTLHFENDPVNDPVKLTDRQNMILQMFHEDKTVSRERLCSKTGSYDASAKHEIAFMKRLGVLKRIVRDKNGYCLVMQ